MVLFQLRSRFVKVSTVLLSLAISSVVIAQNTAGSNSKFHDSEQIKTAVNQQTWTVNFKETDIQELIRFVAKASKKTIIIDPKVKGKVQVISANPVNSEELYQLFLSILEVHGFAAVESGDVTRIIPSKKARTMPVPVVTAIGKQQGSEVITQVIQLENISAAKLIPVLRPLAPQQAHVAAYAPSNAIIITDTSANIARIKQVIKSIDLSAVQKTEVIVLEHASAEEVVRMLEQLKKNESAKGKAETKKLVLVADKRTNGILISGDELERQRVKVLIKHLDTPLAQSGNVKVIYLKYAQAKDLAGVLTKVVQNMGRMGPQAQAKGRAPKKDGGSIEADEGTNSLIVTAEADVMQSVLAVIERLDIRRAQVLVEAIIVEMSADNGRDLGVEWLYMNHNGSYGGSNSTDVGKGVAAAISDEDPRPGIATAIGNATGQVLGVGRLDDGLSFNVMISALQQNTEANILSTPSLLTLDNEEASIVVGQSIPFVTGSYTSTGGSGSNPDNPFQTVQRENVGITLTVTPQINEGDSLILAISQEVSNVLGGSKVTTSSPVTSERKIDTKILADSGQTIVLGGLMDDQISETTKKIPLLGDIPYLGALFRSSATTTAKRQLVIFLRPTIVRDKREMDVVTGKKYRLIRQQQQQEIEKGVDFLEDKDLPLLPEWQQQLEKLQDLQETEQQALDVSLNTAEASANGAGNDSEAQ